VVHRIVTTRIRIHLLIRVLSRCVADGVLVDTRGRAVAAGTVLHVAGPVAEPRVDQRTVDADPHDHGQTGDPNHLLPARYAVSHTYRPGAS
jgi:hypothetical protein